MSAHTPGPWIIDEGKRDGLLMVYADAGGMPGVIINQGRIVARDRANARLIAQAPAMLAVMREIVSSDPIYDDPDSGPFCRFCFVGIGRYNNTKPHAETCEYESARAILATIEGK